MGDERTWPKTVVFQCLDCGAVSNSGETWDAFCAPGSSPDHSSLQEVEVVPASVLEERDRIIEEFRERGMTLDQLLADEVTAAVALRSQLTEARAALTRIRDRDWAPVRIVDGDEEVAALAAPDFEVAQQIAREALAHRIPTQADLDRCEELAREHGWP